MKRRLGRAVRGTKQIDAGKRRRKGAFEEGKGSEAKGIEYERK